MFGQPKKQPFIKMAQLSTLIAEGVEITGNVSFAGGMRIDGRGRPPATAACASSGSRRATPAGPGSSGSTAAMFARLRQAPSGDAPHAGCALRSRNARAGRRWRPERVGVHAQAAHRRARVQAHRGRVAPAGAGGDEPGQQVLVGRVHVDRVRRRRAVVEQRVPVARAPRARRTRRGTRRSRGSRAIAARAQPAGEHAAQVVRDAAAAERPARLRRPAARARRRARTAAPGVRSGTKASGSTGMSASRVDVAQRRPDAVVEAAVVERAAPRCRPRCSSARRAARAPARPARRSAASYRRRAKPPKS